MNIPEDLLYTEEHEWVRLEEDFATVGITDYAQSELTDITFVELPAVGTEVKKGEPMGSVDGIKAVSDIYSPLDGTVVEVNEELADAPELVNQEPYGAGWMVRIEMAEPNQTDSLLSPDDYEKLLG